jgi:hypothetical protein
MIIFSDDCVYFVRPAFPDPLQASLFRIRAMPVGKTPSVSPDSSRPAATAGVSSTNALTGSGNRNPPLRQAFSGFSPADEISIACRRRTTWNIFHQQWKTAVDIVTKLH